MGLNNFAIVLLPAYRAPNYFRIIFGCILARIGPALGHTRWEESSEMAQLAENSDVNLAESRTSNSVMAISLISAHGPEHMYGRSFLVLIPSIYVALGLAPIQAGMLDAVRQLSSGITSMSGGFLVDIFQHRRAQVLSLSMALIGIGYFLVSVAPTYSLILAALALASAGSALWHPPALGLLAQRFPQRRGFSYHYTALQAT